MKYCRLLSFALALLSAPALAQSPEALDYFREGYDLVKKGNYRNAVIELEKSVAADPTYGNAHYILGVSYKALKRVRQSHRQLCRGPDPRHQAGTGR